MKKVLIPTSLETQAADILQAAGYTVIQDANTSVADQAVQHPDASVLIVRSEKITPEIIDAFPSLKLIVRAGAGYDTIDIGYARQRNVDVMNTPGANANAVAEEVVTMVLANFRHVVEGDNTTRAGQWEKKRLMGTELTGKTVGIVGLGNIGRLVAKRMEGFEPTFLGFDPVLAPAKARELGIEPCSLEELFEKSDVITIHVPGGPATKNMVGKDLIERMKPNAVLVNCARFGVVDEDALRAAKAAGSKVQYLTDVYPEDKAGDKPVKDIASLMLPHLGASTLEANLTAASRAAEQTIAYFDHGVTANVVNKGTPDGLNPEYQQLAWRLASVAAQCTAGKLIREIDCTFYGELGPFAKWFRAPILAGLSPHAEQGLMPEAATKMLKDQGITVIDREPLPQKNYGHSMTIDLLADCGEGKLDAVSVRGTITEGVPVISRLNNFENLYFPLVGHSLYIAYADRPGVIAQIALTLAEQGINIENITAPRDHKAGTSLVVIRTDQPVPAETLTAIKEKVSALTAFSLSL